MEDRSVVYPLRALGRAAIRFSDKGGWVVSSHVAMSMMLALFPFMLFIVALASVLTQQVDSSELIGLIMGTWPDDIAAPIERELSAVMAASKTGPLTLGAALALYFASNGVDAIRVAMVRAYRDTDPRPFWKQRLVCLVFVIGGSAVVLMAAVLELFLPLYLHFVADAVPDGLRGWIAGDWAAKALTVALTVFAVFSFHMWLSGSRHTMAEVWPGVLLSFALWWVMARAFGWYIAKFASYSATYAGLAGAMAALIFLYLLAAILILGAEFNGVLARERRNRAEQPVKENEK